MRVDHLRTLPPGDGRAVQSNFRWNVPDDFSIAHACCDRWASDAPDRTAIIEIGASRRVWSYGDLKDASDRLAAYARSKGVQKGDRVAILLAQSPYVMIAHFAAMKLGAITVPLFTLFGEEALAYRLKDSGAVFAITDDENLGKLKSAAEGSDLRAIITTPLADAMAFDPLPRCEPVLAETPAMLIYTSGTTGPPKGALHAHRFLIGHLPAVELVMERFPQEGDIGWTPADWAWIGGLMDLAMPCLYFGVPLVANRMRKFDPAAAYDMIAREKITALFLPPTALKMMRQVPVPSGVDIRAIGSGGESLATDLLDWGRDTLGAAINELYGQTECNLVVASCQGLERYRAGTMGQAVPGHAVAIIDSEGNPLPDGETGEIAVRKPDPVMFLGYWNLPEKSAEKFVGDWLRTGDLGVMDADGYVTYVSRDDDVITSAGYRIGPTEIENCLTGDPDVLLAAAVGVPDPERTEIVKAFIVPRQGASLDGLADRLIQRVKDRVSPHVAPRAVEFVDELPMTATGKVRRRDLRDRG